MERKKTLTMNWDALGDHDVDDDDDDRFFETYSRLSSVVPIDLASSGSDEDYDHFDDSRMSFASAISSLSTAEYRNYAAVVSPKAAASVSPEYDIWMAAPGSITERRKRLLQGMGLNSNKELLKIATKSLKRDVTKKIYSTIVNGDCNSSSHVTTDQVDQDTKLQEPSPSPPPVLLVRSRSDGDIESFSVDRERKANLLGLISKQRLTRTSSMIIVSHARLFPSHDPYRVSPKTAGSERSVVHSSALTTMLSNNRFGAFFLIKNLDTGKEFIVNEYDQDGMWNRVSDLQTGKKLTMEEFEKCVGHSPVVKELMRRENAGRMNGIDNEGNDQKINANSYLSKSLRVSKRRGAALLKNIKGVAYSISMSGSSRIHEPKPEPKLSKQSEWIKVRQTGKSHKDLSALHLCQEIQAHQGSIWTIKFSSDARFLASGGEDRVIHVWEVQECELMSLPDTGNLTPLHPSLCSSTSSLGELTPMPSERRKKWKGSSSGRKGNPIPEYVHVPETVFSLSEKPVCSFTGHLDDVLDLSWSRSQLLLSSSMDKTVRLWDMETKSCLKLFAHNDYVTCIQFHPMDERYFISGSLDAKVRIWSIPNRQLVDWTDLHEMVTAVCYTPDGQAALVGTHKGSCRKYNSEDCKLNEVELVEVQNKKRSHAKKITGFQFSPGNPSEVLVTSADSRIRIFDGSELVHKFRGFRNINSQISASFSPEGKYLMSASEDSHVYVWKREESRGKGKNVINTRSHESFQCRDVSVAIPWNGKVKGDPPPVQLHSKRHSKRSSQPSSVISSPTKDDDAAANSKRYFPPSANASPTREESSSIVNSKRPQLPPLPRKNNTDRSSPTPQEDDMCLISPTESDLGDSFASTSSSIRYGDSLSISAPPSPSPSWSSSLLSLDGGNQVCQNAPTAWGLVIVTATLGGGIRAYQNFGLPRKIGRQVNLF